MRTNGSERKLSIASIFTRKRVSLDKATCSAAAVNGGHLECLKYLHDKGCPWDKTTCSSAAEGGHLECLKYLHDKGCPWDEELFFLLLEAVTECLKYLYDKDVLG